MGKVLLKIALIILSLIGIVTVIGYILPRDYSTEASVTINASMEDVFERVNTPEQWTNWSPWSPKRIPDLTISYEGETRGEGAIMKWQDPRPNSRFDGQLEITSSQLHERIEFSVRMGEVPMDGYFEFEDVAGKTKVTWIAAGELPSGASYGWFGLTYNGFLGNELKNSLQRLKEVSEGQKKIR